MKNIAISLLALFIQAAPAQQQPTTSSISGVVLAQGTDSGLPKVTVLLYGTDAPAPPLTTLPALTTGTDSEGRFSFRNLPAGRYVLTTALPGYVQSGYSEPGPGGSGLPVTVTKAQQLSGVRLQMVRTGAVSGRVTDRRRQALGAVVVQALKTTFPNGQPTMAVIRSEQTNDLGEYRLFGLPPGGYLINVLPPGVPNPANGLVVNPNGPQVTLNIRETRSRVGVNSGSVDLRQNEDFSPVFYPSTINVGPGAEIQGIDMSVVPSQVSAIRGITSDNSSGAPAAYAQIQLLPLKGWSGYATVSDATGMFVFPKVLSGGYRLVASLGAANGPTGRVVQIPLEVGDLDQTLSIRMDQGFALSGKILFEGVGTPRLASFRVALQPDVSIPSAGMRIVPAADGRPVTPTPLHGREVTPGAAGAFNLRNLAPGPYRVLVTPGRDSRNTYVKSIRLGAVDVLSEGLRLDVAPADPLEIVMATAAGEIRGRVVNDRQQAVSSVPVVLIPGSGRARRTDLYRSVVTDVDGRFRVEGVPPGDYGVFAWENVETGVWFDAEFLRFHEDRGKVVTVGDATSQEITLSVIN
jgi:hypothetical protein